eukprot:3844167-Amphidinium_carterae.1
MTDAEREGATALGWNHHMWNCLEEDFKQASNAARELYNWSRIWKVWILQDVIYLGKMMWEQFSSKDGVSRSLGGGNIDNVDPRST